jgi:hypothetical protein
MKSVGMRTRSATPIQKSEKTRAVMRETRSVPTVKETKSARGVKERRSWMTRNVCDERKPCNLDCGFPGLGVQETATDNRG